MRKLFRMKYEACNGQCYEYDDVMKINTLGLDVKGAVEFLKRLVAIHEPSCGNPNIEYRLDVDEFTRTKSPYDDNDYSDTRFVASFYHYGSLDLFSGDTPLEALNILIDAALTYYQSDDYRSRDKGLGHEVCRHGTNKKLIEFAISFSGLDKNDQDMLREQFVC